MPFKDDVNGAAEKWITRETGELGSDWWSAAPASQTQVHLFMRRSEASNSVASRQTCRQLWYKAWYYEDGSGKPVVTPRGLTLSATK